VVLEPVRKPYAACRKQAYDVHGDVPLAPVDYLPGVEAAAGSGDRLGGFTDWESITAAAGSGLRPAAMRHWQRSSPCMTVVTPVACQPARQSYTVDQGGRSVGMARHAQQQLPAARQHPGFKGSYLLAGAETGKLMTISLWETREDLAAVEAQAAQIRSQAAPAIRMTTPHLETYEVAMHA
jgi:heme-degrading monooxygenase HmoA